MAASYDTLQSKLSELSNIISRTRATIDDPRGVKEAITSVKLALRPLKFSSAQVDSVLKEYSRQINDSNLTTRKIKGIQSVVNDILGQYKNSILGAITNYALDNAISNQIIKTKRLELKKLQEQLSSKTVNKENLDKVAKQLEKVQPVSKEAREKLEEFKLAKQTNLRQKTLYEAQRAEARRKKEDARLSLTERAAAAAEERAALTEITKIQNKLSKILEQELTVTAALTEQQKSAVDAYKRIVEKYNESVDEGDKLSTSFTNLESAADQLKQKMKKNEDVLEQLTEKEKNLIEEVESAEIDSIKNFSNMMTTVINALSEFVKGVRETQRQFGIAAGLAAEMNIENFVESAKSYIDSLKSGFSKTAVSAEEIRSAQESFMSEFGSILTEKEARGIAEEAKGAGLSVEDYAKARRTFMTETMGDTGKAIAQQTKFMAEFQKKGLTAKVAMQSIQQNSELLARNGTRFATSFAKAAADSKIIGVELSKVDQVGDSIIGNFEGFLENVASLGAMGFDLDVSRLGQLAESGDTASLMNELRTELANTGKDITKLTRSQQLQLSQTFGLSMAEIQRMAGKTGAPGEVKSPEELQADANGFLNRTANATEAALPLLRAIAAAQAFPKLADLIKKFPGGLGGLGRMAGLKGMLSSAGAASKFIKIGGSSLAAGLGAYEGYTAAKKSGASTASAVGSAAVQGGSAAAGTYGGAALGTIILPGIGTAIGASLGGFLGNAIGKGINNQVRKTGDDVISRPGYGERQLVTPTTTVALNNKDNIIAYADDLVTNNLGLQFGSLGQFAPKQTTPQNTNVVVDLSKLEAKLDALVRAIGSMQVEMDGTKVGKVIANSEIKAVTYAPIRAQRL